MGIVIVVAYHKVNQYAEAAGADDRLNPALALWVPFVILTAMVLWMYHVLAHRPGGDPRDDGSSDQHLARGSAHDHTVEHALLDRQHNRD